MKEIVVGVDIGGSHIGIGLIDLELRTPISSSSQVKVAHLSSVEELIDLLTRHIRELAWRNSVALMGVGVGAPGQCLNGVLTSAANILPEQRNIQIAPLLSEALGHIPVVLINDADAYIAAEVLSSRFKEEHGDIKSAAMVTLGTGIGFSLYLNRQFYEGAHGLLEGGHMIVCPAGGPLCGCGQHGCVEMFSSAKNTALRFARLSSRAA